jgi:hypothetical protein
MIFVSYSHGDNVARALRKNLKAAKPRGIHGLLVRQGHQDGRVGAAIAAVLLVSDNFRLLTTSWIRSCPTSSTPARHVTLRSSGPYLEPCDLRRFPQIKQFQAMTLGELKPIAAMSQWEWKQTMLKGCDMIDEFLMDRERPSIAGAVVGKSYPRIAKLPLLAKPTRRRVEVLVYAGQKWWRQPSIYPGMTTTTIYLGDDTTKKGTRFTVIAMTTDKPLPRSTFLSLPECRTKSPEFVVVRG